MNSLVLRSYPSIDPVVSIENALGASILRNDDRAVEVVPGGIVVTTNEFSKSFGCPLIASRLDLLSSNTQVRELRPALWFYVLCDEPAENIERMAIAPLRMDVRTEAPEGFGKNLIFDR